VSGLREAERGKAENLRQLVEAAGGAVAADAAALPRVGAPPAAVASWLLLGGGGDADRRWLRGAKAAPGLRLLSKEQLTQAIMRQQLPTRL
jgi:hypothetical protein